MHRLARDDLHAIIALVDGLTVAIRKPDRPLPRADARRLLDRHTRTLLAE